MPADFYRLPEGTQNEITKEAIDVEILSPEGEELEPIIEGHEVSSISPMSINGDIQETHVLDVLIPMSMSHTEETSNIDMYNHMKITLRINYSSQYNSEGNIGYLIKTVTVYFTDVSGQADVQRGDLNVVNRSTADPTRVRNISFTGYTYSYSPGFTEYSYENDWEYCNVAANATGYIVHNMFGGNPWTVTVSWTKL